MFLRFSFIGLAATILLCLPVHAQDSNSRATPEPTPARQRVNPNITPKEQTEFDAAKADDDAGSSESALSKYRRFLKSNPASPLAAKAQTRIAEIYYNDGNMSKAFDAYEKLITQYPDTPDFDKAITHQVLIANEYLGGRNTKFLGLEIVSGTDRAEEMYTAILKNAPYSKNAPVAQFNLGITYERQGKTKEAAAAYQRLLDKYPSSSLADDALYQIGYIYMQLGEKGKSEDLSALITAKNTFEDFLLQYPQSEKAAQAKDNLKKMSSKESGDLLEIAKYYDRFKNYKAASIYYNDIIRRSPGTAESKLAQERIQALRSEVGDDALRIGPEKAETGEKAALRRRLQAQVESTALPDYNGPPSADIVSNELPVVNKPKLRTNSRDSKPMPTVEPALPIQ